MAETWFERTSGGAETWAARDTLTDEATITPDHADISVAGPGAATLWRDRVIATSVGSVTVTGRLPSTALNLPSPLSAAIAVSGRQPIVQQTAGPRANPSRASVSIEVRDFTLWKIRVVNPTLSASTETENDLTPTILLGNSSTAGVPGVGYAYVEGRLPVVVRDGSTTIEFNDALYPVNAAGLTPTIVLPLQFDGFKAPFRGEIDLLGLTPTIFGSRSVTPDPCQMQMFGNVSLSKYDYSWRTVALTGSAEWSDIPPAT